MAMASEDHPVVRAQVASPAGGAGQGAVLAGIGAGLGVAMATLDGVADLGESGVEFGGGLAGQLMAAPPGQMAFDLVLEFEFGDVGQVNQRRRRGCRGCGDAAQHGGQQGVAESACVGGVREQAFGKSRLGQTFGVACGAAAERRVRIDLAAGPVQPGFDARIGPGRRGHHLDDAIAAFDLASFDLRGLTDISGLEAHWAIPRLSAKRSLT
jgi:hypothetical protein